jgi:hypothetical protein
MTRRRTVFVTFLLITMWLVTTSASEPKRLGEIEFFGYKGLDVTAVRNALPFREGEPFPPAKAKSSDDLKRQVSQSVRQIVGREPTDISFVCCNAKDAWTVYIGLPGESYQALAFDPPPSDAVRLPKMAMKLRQEMDDAWMGAVMSGHATEDDSEGYTLTNDPKARKAQLAIRDYALQNEPLILRVLASSSDAAHRATAAHMLGYARQSDEQIDALVRASLDNADDVRNNAVRALWVLAGAKSNLAQRIPPEPFLRLLRSGTWSDHNKASLLFLALTKRREPQLLARLRAEAFDPLLEMAGWRNMGHAAAALSILGRMAGILEEPLNTLIEAGQRDTILAEVNRP